MTGLALLEKAERMLAQVQTVEDAVDLADYAEAARVFARKAKLGAAAQNHALSIRLRAERRMADLVDQGQKAGTIATQARPENIPKRNICCDRPAPVTLDTIGITAKQVHEARAIRDKFTDEQIDQAAKDATQTLTRSLFVKPHVTNNTGENEWYTPPEFIEAARAAFLECDECYDPDTCGCPAITTDPATSRKAQETIQAKVAYTVDDDGLTKEWHGRVWLNPPYAQPLIGRFIDKLLAELDAGRTREAIVLVNNASETQWGAKLLGRCQAACFPTGRIRFLDATGNPANTPLQGQMLLYFTTRNIWDIGQELMSPDSRRMLSDKFAEAFSRFGPVLQRQ